MASGVLKLIWSHVLFVQFVQSSFTSTTVIFICVRHLPIEGLTNAFYYRSDTDMLKRGPCFV